MKKKISDEIKTGVMVVACLVILAGLTVKVSGLTTLKKGYEIKAQFNYASGVKKGAPVYLTGVEAGEIKDVGIDYTDGITKVVLSLWLTEDAKPRVDSIAYIAAMGLMGEKYIELTSGSRDAEFLQPGSLIVGKESLSMDEIMDRAVDLADNLDAGIGDLRKLTNDFDSALVENRAHIDEIIKNMNSTSKNFKEFSADVKAHPWKLLFKGKEDKKRDKKKRSRRERDNKGRF